MSFPCLLTSDDMQALDPLDLLPLRQIVTVAAFLPIDAPCGRGR